MKRMPLSRLWMMLFVLAFCLAVDAQEVERSGEVASGDTAAAETILPDDDDIELSDPAPEESVEDSLPPLESMPELRRFVEAGYPAEAVKEGREGTVVMDLLISDSGTVDSVAVVEGLGPSFDSAACKAARRFEFVPAMVDSSPVPVILRYEYRFVLQEAIRKAVQDRREAVNFRGRLIEMGTRAPVSNAMIVVSFPDTVRDTSLALPWESYLEHIAGLEGQYREEGRLVTLSDTAGAFSFTSLPAGPIEISVVLSGYETFFDRETITADSLTEVTYRLERTSYSDYEIVVYGKAPKKEVARRSLTLREVRKVPGFGGDAVKVIQAMPGVSRSFFGGGEIIVRGAGSGDNQYFLDGLPIPYVYHFGGLKSNYNSSALESVDFYPGGFGVRYGNALGGVVEIKGRSPKTDRWHGFVDVNLFDASFLYEMPVNDKVSFLLSARRSYIADVVSFALENVLHQSLPFTVVPFYWDYVGRVDIAPADNHKVFATLFGTKDKLEMIQTEVRGGSVEIDESTDKLDAVTRFDIQMGGWDWKLSPQWENRLRCGLSEHNEDVSAFGYFKYKLEGVPYAFRDVLSYQPSEKYRYVLGLYMLVGAFEHSMATTDTTNLVVKDTTDYLFGPWAGYLALEWNPTEQLQLIPGIRYDYYPELQHNGSLFPEFWDYESERFDEKTRFPGEPSLRVSGRYDARPGHTVKGSVGNYSQTPQPRGQATHPRWGNPDLKAVKGSQYVLGYEWQLTDLIHLDLQGYLNYQWQRSRIPSERELRSGGNLPAFVDNGKARMRGLELFVRHDQGTRFFGWLSYSLARSERYDYQEQRWRLYNRDILNYIQLIASRRFRNNMELGVRARYSDGYPTTPINGAKLYDGTHFYYIPDEGAAQSERMTPYVGVDLRFEKKFVFTNWMLTLYTEAINLAHYLRFVKKENGDPLFDPPETDFYIWSYNYEHRNAISDIPRHSVGVLAEF